MVMHMQKREAIITLFIAICLMIATISPVAAFSTTRSQGGVFNGGFETGSGSQTVNGWIGSENYGWYTEIWTATTELSYDSNISASGGKSLKMVVTSSGAGQYSAASHVNRGILSNMISGSSRYLIPMKPSTKYILTAKIKTSAITSAQSGGIKFSLTEYNSTFAPTISSTNYITGTTNWTVYQIPITTQSSTIFGQIGLSNSFETGTAWFDDISLEEVVIDTTDISSIPQVWRPVFTANTSLNNIDQNQTTFESTTPVGDAGGADYISAQSFIPTKSKLTGITFYKSANTGSPTGDFLISIRTDNSNKPSTTAIASYKYTLAQYNALSTGENFVTLPCLVTAGTRYWIVFTDTASESTDVRFNVGVQGTGTYPGGQRAYSANAETTWTLDDYDLYFKSHYAKLTEDVTIVANGARYKLSADQDGLLGNSTIDLSTGQYSYTSANLNGSSSRVQNTQMFIQNIYSADYGVASSLFPPLGVNGYYISDPTSGIVSANYTNGSLIMKINTILPAKKVNVSIYFPSQADRRINTSYSIDGVNYVQSFMHYNDGVTRDWINYTPNNNISFIKFTSYIVNQYTGIARMDISADLNLSEINQTPSYIFPINTAPLVNQSFTGAAATRIYFRTNTYENTNKVTMPALEFRDISDNYISNYTLPFDNSQETNPAINIHNTSTGYSQTTNGSIDSATGGVILNPNEYMTFTGTPSSGSIIFTIGKGTTAFSNITQNTFYLSSNGAANSSTLDPSHQMAVSTANRSLITTGITTAFTGTPLNGTVPLSVRFTDSTSGVLTNPYSTEAVTPNLTNLWNFGNGNTTNNTATNPVSTYFAAGTSFDVTLNKLWYGYSVKSLLKPSYLTTNTSPSLLANFTANQTLKATYPMAVQFTDESTGSPVTWNWTFGDGYTSTSQNPIHWYSVAGQYSVSLNVTNASGSHNLSVKPDYITLTTDTDPFLKSWLHFNTSATLDQMGNAWAASGATFTTTPTRFGGGSLAVQSSNAYISTPSSTAWNIGHGDFALEFWINPTAPGVSRNLVSRTTTLGAGTTSGWGFHNNGSASGYTFWMGSLTNATPTFSLVNNAWQFVSIQRSSGVLHVAVNGTEVTNRSQPGTYDTANPVFIGSFGFGTEETFYMNEFRFSNQTRWNISSFSPPFAAYNGNPASLADRNVNSTFRYKTNPGDYAVIFNQTNGGTRNRTIQIQNVTTANYLLGGITFDPMHEIVKAIFVNTTSIPDLQLLGGAVIDNTNGVATFNVSRNDPNNAITSLFNNRTNIVDVQILYWNYSDEPDFNTFFSNGVIIDNASTYNYPIHYFINTSVTYGDWDFYPDFVANVTAPQIYQPVGFTDLTVGYPNLWNLSFGDGTFATSLPATHTYTTAGLYTVTLTESLWQNASVTNSTTKVNYINVTPIYPPVTDFSANVTSVVIGQPIKFTDTSTNVPTTWNWTFGDGGFSTSQNPIYSYSTVGLKTVTLNTTNVAGFDLEIKTNYISVTPAYPSPIADFVAVPLTIQIGDPIQFYDTSANTPTSWNWSFGDGTYSNQQNPSHIYATAGTYTISLTATNAYGTNTATKVNYITITTPYAPVAAFSGTPTSTYTLGTVQFTDQSLYLPTSWVWDFGDGLQSTAQDPAHVYTAAGTYTVTLTVTNAWGTDSEVKVGYITISGVPPTTPPMGYVITNPATEISNNTVTMNGYTTSASYKYYFEYGYQPGVYAYATAQTTGTDPSGNFSETVTGLPLLADETYFFRAVITENSHYISGNELSYTLTQSEPLDLYPEYKTRGDALIQANWDFDTLLVVIPSPFVDTMGAIFYGIIIGGAFILLWTRTKKIIIPSLFGILTGGVLWNILPPDWVAFGTALFYVSIGGFLYGIILGRQS